MLKVEIYSGSWLSVQDATRIRIEDHKAKNSIAMFSLPQGSSNAGLVVLNAEVRILDADDTTIFQGLIVSPLGVTPFIINVNCVDYAIYLSRLITGYAFPLNNRGSTRTLEHTLETLLQRQEIRRWVTASDFALGTSVKTETISDNRRSDENAYVQIDAIAAYKGGFYTTGDRYWQSPTIDLTNTPDATAYGLWGLLRVAYELSSTSPSIKLTVKVRTGSSEANLLAASWSGEVEINEKGVWLDNTHADSDTPVYGSVVNITENQWFQYRIFFYNNTISRFSPRLYAVELIVFRDSDISKDSGSSWSALNITNYTAKTPSYISHTRAVNSLLHDKQVDEIWKVNSSKELEVNYGKQRLFYDSLVTAFNVAATVTGATSGATATIDADNGTDTLTISAVTGIFQNDETITDDGSPAGEASVTAFVRRQNINVQRGEEVSDGLYNDIIALGSGSGLNQLLEWDTDTNSITAYGRRMHIVPIANDDSQLASRLTDFLDEHSEPFARVQIELPIALAPGDFSCADTVLVKTDSIGTVSGTAQALTDTTTLIDNTATFQTDGVIAGMVLENTTRSDNAKIMQVDSEVQLTIAPAIAGQTSGDAYYVRDWDWYQIIQMIRENTVQGEIVSLYLSNKTDVFRFNLNFIEDYLREKEYFVQAGLGSDASKRSAGSDADAPTKSARHKRFMGSISGVNNANFDVTNRITLTTGWDVDGANSWADVVRIVNEATGSDVSFATGDVRLQRVSYPDGDVTPASGSDDCYLQYKRASGSDDITIYYEADLWEEI